MSNIKKYISFDEFCFMAGKSKATVIKNYKLIPGIEKHGNEYLVLEGTRYIAPIKHYKIKTNDSKRYAILDCISKERYVDYKMVGLYENSFVDILSDFLSANLIRYNRNSNSYSTNAFDITEEGNKILAKKKNKAMEIINDIIINLTSKIVAEVVFKS